MVCNGDLGVLLCRGGENSSTRYLHSTEEKRKLSETPENRKETTCTLGCSADPTLMCWAVAMFKGVPLRMASATEVARSTSRPIMFTPRPIAVALSSNGIALTFRMTENRQRRCRT